MSRLLKYLSPFAPDDSGACSVLYEMGGITVIVDAGGCTGNVCGFDEPRWHEKKSALLSAGLRDMDAILGRDDRLAEKLARACRDTGAPFAAVVGTPVPAVIATDFRALGRLCEKKTGIPCLALPTDGTKHYDAGAEMAYAALFDRFAKEKLPVKPGKIGILGATPLDTGFTRAEEICADGNAVIFGMGSELEAVQNASECAEIRVISPCGLKAAKLLQERFGTLYTVKSPVPKQIAQKLKNAAGKRILIIHQQFAANALRETLPESAACDCASWFTLFPEFAHENDFRLQSEAQFREAAAGYDVIVGDQMLRRAAPGFSGEWIDWPHFAVSGRLWRDCT